MRNQTNPNSRPRAALALAQGRGAVPFARLASTGAVLLATAAHAGPPVPYQVYYNPQRATSTVFEDPHYNHAATVAEFGNRVYVAWNGNAYNSSESQAGQVIMLSTSDDGGAHWSPRTMPFVKEYRAMDDNEGKGIDAAPGNADDNHKVRYKAARQWQPSLTVFHGKLLMFWGVDRSTDGAAMLMSTPDGDSGQWRTNELHFKGDGTPYFLPEIDAKAPATDDPPSLAMESGARYSRIPGAAAIPQTRRLAEVPAAMLKTVSPSGSPDVALAGHRLVPSPNHATVVRTRDGAEVLVVSVVLHETQGEWDAVTKIPAVFTTTDLEHWQLSMLPMRGGAGDLTPGGRGDIGLISGWEPSVEVDRRGQFRMEFRMNLPPALPNGANPPGTGYRAAVATGTYEPNVGVHWEAPHLADLDVPSTRSMLSRVSGQQRWVMVANHMVQGVSYDGDTPVFRGEKYEPFARSNLEMFFSTRGTDDFVAGLNISGNDEEGVEMVHYPYVQSESVGGRGDDMLIVYSTHRREKSCVKGHGAEAACHDSIRFVRIKDMPDPKRPAIYPNHFAHYFSYGKGKPQDGTYNFGNNGMLTLHDRGSAGIETGGRRGCMNLRYRLDGDLAPNQMRPVLSFGRTGDRANPIGLVMVGAGGGARIMLGERQIGQAGRGAWNSTRVCYDFNKGTLSAGDVEWTLGPSRVSMQTYLGDNTLARRNPLPDLTFDVPNTTLEVGEED